MSVKQDKATRRVVRRQRDDLISDYLQRNREYIMVKAVEYWARKPLRQRIAICYKILRGNRWQKKTTESKPANSNGKPD